MAVKTLLIVAAILAVSVFAFAAAKPDFNGTWSMDRGRSFGLPPDMNQTMTVTQNGDQIDIETKLIQPNNERSVKDTYILDGKEHDFTPPAPPNQPAPKGKRTAMWLPNDRGIQVTDITTAETPKGTVTNQTVRKWTISGSGELVIDMYIDNANASYEAKRIFIKK